LNQQEEFFSQLVIDVAKNGVLCVPVDEDAGFGEHQKPQVHEALLFKHHGERIVDQHSTVGQPKSGEHHNHYDQHLHHL